MPPDVVKAFYLGEAPFTAPHRLKASQAEWAGRSQKIATGLDFPAVVDYHDACGKLCCEVGGAALRCQELIIKKIVAYI